MEIWYVCAGIVLGSTVTFLYCRCLIQYWQSKATVNQASGLPNRLGLFQRCASALALYERGSIKRLTVVYIDLEDFKGVNDTLGHDAGDAALRMFANILLTLVRASDVAAHLHGDEFVVFMPDAEANEVLQATTRWMNAFKRKSIETFGCELTFRFGVATVHDEANVTLLHLLQQADMRMNATRGGR